MATTRNESGDGDAPIFDQLRKLTKSYEQHNESLAEIKDDYDKMAKTVADVVQALEAFKANASDLSKIGANKESKITDALKKDSKESRKMNTELQQAIMYSSRGVADKIVKAILGKSSFLQPHVPGAFGVGGSLLKGLGLMAAISTLEAVVSKFIDETKAQNAATLESFSRGLNLQESTRIMVDQIGAMQISTAEERQKVISLLMSNRLRDLKQNDPRTTALAVGEMLGENIGEQASLLADLKFILKQDGDSQVSTLRDLREIGRSTGAGIDQMVQLTKQSIEANKSLYAIVGPENLKAINQAIANVAATAGVEDKNLEKFISSLLNNPQAAYKLGVAEDLNKLGSDTNANVRIIQRVMSRVSQFSKTVEGMPLTQGKLIADQYTEIFGADMFRVAAAIDQAANNIENSLVKGLGKKLENTSQKIAQIQDPERMVMTNLTNKVMPQMVEGMREMVQSLQDLTHEFKSYRTSDNSGIERFRTEVDRRR